MTVTGFADRWRERGSLYNDIVTWAEDQWLVRTTGELIRFEPHQKLVLRTAFTKGLWLPYLASQWGMNLQDVLPEIENALLTGDPAAMRRLLDPQRLDKYPFETIVWSEPKKSGKTEIGGIVTTHMALTEPAPEIYMIANDLEQARSRAFSAISQVVKKNEVLNAECRVLRSPRPRIEVPDGFIEAIPSDYAGEAGANPVLTAWDELWAYMKERARRLWDEFTPVPTRRNSLRLITTYAGFMGESELLWELYDRCVLQGIRLHPTLELYTDQELTTLALWSHTPRMPWQTPDYYRRQKAQLRESAYRRLHGNEWVSAEDAFITAEDWEALPKISVVQRASKAFPVYIGIDSAHKRDCVAVSAIGWARDQGPFLLRYAVWKPQKDEPVLPEETAEPYVRALAKKFNVRGILYDPAHFESCAVRLARSGLPMQQFTQQGENLMIQGNALYDAIKSRQLHVFHAPELREHVLNVVVRETSRGWKLTRALTSRKIDLAIASALALVAALERGPIDAKRGAGITLI